MDNINKWSKDKLKVKYIELLFEYNNLNEAYEGAKEIINGNENILKEINIELEKLKILNNIKKGLKN